MLKLSVSSIGTFEKCPKKYYFNYIEKPNIIRQKHDFTEFGSCAHQILENFHNYILDNPHSKESEWPGIMKKSFVDGVKKFDINLLSLDTWAPDGSMPGIKLVRKIMQDYLNKLREDGMPNVVGIETAYKFEIKEGAYIRGYIDRIDKIDDETYHVVDYKTSKSLKYLTNFQLLVYAEAVRKMFPDAKTVHGSYNMLKHGCKLVSWKFTDMDYKDCVKKLWKKEVFKLKKKKFGLKNHLCFVNGVTLRAYAKIHGRRIK